MTMKQKKLLRACIAMMIIPVGCLIGWVITTFVPDFFMWFIISFLFAFLGWIGYNS